MEKHEFKAFPDSSCANFKRVTPLDHPFCSVCYCCFIPECGGYHPHGNCGEETIIMNSSSTLTKPGHPRFYELLDEIASLHSKKNTDYAKGMKEGPLGNFTRVSYIMGLYPDMDWDSPFGVALVYSFKQLDAALTLRSTKRESVTGEPVSRRLMDIVIYGLIAMIIAEEETNP